MEKRTARNVRFDPTWVICTLREDIILINVNLPIERYILCSNSKVFMLVTPMWSSTDEYTVELTQNVTDLILNEQIMITLPASLDINRQQLDIHVYVDNIEVDKQLIYVVDYLANKDNEVITVPLWGNSIRKMINYVSGHVPNTNQELSYLCLFKIHYPKDCTKLVAPRMCITCSWNSPVIERKLEYIGSTLLFDPIQLTGVESINRRRGSQKHITITLFDGDKPIFKQRNIMIRSLTASTNVLMVHTIMAELIKDMADLRTRLTNCTSST